MTMDVDLEAHDCFHNQWVAFGVVIALLRLQAHHSVDPPRDNAESVMLNFVNPQQGWYRRNMWPDGGKIWLFGDISPCLPRPPVRKRPPRSGWRWLAKFCALPSKHLPIDELPCLLWKPTRRWETSIGVPPTSFLRMIRLSWHAAHFKTSVSRCGLVALTHVSPTGVIANTAIPWTCYLGGRCAQAADLPVKAKPVEYVKVCSLYGVGFYYIPGTDICMKLGGYVRFQQNFGSTDVNSFALSAPLKSWMTVTSLDYQRPDRQPRQSRSSLFVRR